MCHCLAPGWSHRGFVVRVSFHHSFASDVIEESAFGGNDGVGQSLLGLLGSEVIYWDEPGADEAARSHGVCHIPVPAHPGIEVLLEFGYPSDVIISFNQIVEDLDCSFTLGLFAEETQHEQDERLVLLISPIVVATPEAWLVFRSPCHPVNVGAHDSFIAVCAALVSNE